MKLRVFPIVATVAVSALLLFGGWYGYRQIALQTPLQKMVTQYNGVNSAQLDINHNTVTLKLDLKPQTDLRDLVQHIKDKGGSLINGKELKLEVEDHSSAALNKWWSEALFPIAEAMENKKYTEITSALDKLKAKQPGLKATAEMDDTNVYISLTDGQASKFIILPRKSEEIGVWNNA
ncbi:hypothetical protein [Paenibacillus physcomitrellae]|uniref:Uncharacterized protein n=1 Tax=Paenibacillus physcomitrellae TaxID=1619311 RepID=A0ABQ1FQC6_9BACL|nr:hypothetical protein [Paenibacillus physcomitrellae]GGA23400.1 hypothetical protein GCM10010917_05200 [Paenibacillus physcomitrellae]